MENGEEIAGWGEGGPTWKCDMFPSLPSGVAQSPRSLFVDVFLLNRLSEMISIGRDVGCSGGDFGGGGDREGRRGGNRRRNLVLVRRGDVWGAGGREGLIELRVLEESNGRIGFRRERGGAGREEGATTE